MIFQFVEFLINFCRYLISWNLKLRLLLNRQDVWIVDIAIVINQITIYKFQKRHLKGLPTKLYPLKMEIFQAFKENYAILGINAYQSLQPYPFNIKILMTFLMFSLSTTSHLVYIFNVANTFTEYTECITTTSGSFIISLCFATMVFKMTTLFEFIAKIEEIIAMSESI